jgi:N-acetylglucosaminyldiphosphoundecaprenol N-acetyl-beta-D-mannosaminyltransferase
MLKRLERAKPDIVYVAMGCPKQEQFIAAYRHILPRAWWLGVGISFSFLAGRVKRAPRFVQCTGLEWLHRLVQEPRRLCRRYLLEGLPFAASVLVHAAEERLFADANGLALKSNRQETRADFQ